MNAHLLRTSRRFRGRQAQITQHARSLCPGDLATVTRFDQFGIATQIVGASGQLRSFNGSWPDTSTSAKPLIINVLGYLADVAWNLTGTRAAQGRSRARACWQDGRRPLKFMPRKQVEARRSHAEGTRLAELAAICKYRRIIIVRLI